MRKLFYHKPLEKKFMIRAALGFNEYGNYTYDGIDFIKGYYTREEASHILQFKIKDKYGLDPLDYVIIEDL